MAKIETDKLTPEQRAQVQKDEGDDMPQETPTGIGLKAVPEPWRTILVLILAGIGMFGGGAAGQMSFGINEERLNQRLDEKFRESDAKMEAKIDLMKAEDAGKALIVKNNTDDIREALTLLRDMDKRLTKVEAKVGVED